MVKPYLRHPLLYIFSKLRKTEADALQVLHGFADDVIRKRRQELMGNAIKPGNNDENGADDVGIRKKRALLDILLYSSIDGKPLSDGDIREEVDTFMFGVRRFFFHRFFIDHKIGCRFSNIFFLIDSGPRHDD